MQSTRAQELARAQSKYQSAVKVRVKSVIMPEELLGPIEIFDLFFFALTL